MFVITVKDVVGVFTTKVENNVYPQWRIYTIIK